jgi:hypothetical protein
MKEKAKIDSLAKAMMEGLVKEAKLTPAQEKKAFIDRQKPFKDAAMPIIKDFAAKNGYELRTVNDLIYGSLLAICDDKNNTDLLIEWLAPDEAIKVLDQYQYPWPIFHGRKKNSRGIVLLYGLYRPCTTVAQIKSNLAKELAKIMAQLPKMQYVHSGD